MNKKTTPFIIFILLVLLSTGYLEAQSVYDQLSGKIDLVVDINGSGDFTTVQEAIDSVPDNNDTWKVIFVKKGTYYEKVVLGVTKTKVILVGEDVYNTIITYDDYANKVMPGHTFSTYTFRADAPDFQAYNITFECTAGDRGQGVAFHGNGDCQILYHCRLLGNQDTYFDNIRQRRYIKDCFIEGGVDYIFGFGVTLFDSCQLHTNRNGGYVTAASTPQHYEFGYVFKNCRLTSGLDVSGFVLGRPWFDWANTVFYECWEPEELSGSGWSGWAGRENTCFYREYNCYGPGSDTTNRVEFGKQLDPSRASRYITDTIFAAGNFPTHLGYEGDTTEVMHIYRRFEASGYPERAVIMLAGGRDTFPEYPAEDWSPVFYDEVCQVIKNNTLRMMDSANGEINIENLLLDNIELDGFDPGMTDYVIELNENDTTGPVISLVSDDAIVSVDYPSSLPGFAKVTALSKDKANGATYSLYYSKDSAYWDTEVKLILVNYKDTVQLEPGVREYNMQLGPGATKVSSVIVHSKVQGQLVVKTIPPTLPGDIEIEVTALDKVTRDKYIIHVAPPTGINDAVCPEREKISLINPARNKLLLLNQYDQPLSPDIAIFDLNGKLLCSASIKELSGGISEVNIDMSSLNAGIYIYRIRLEENDIFGKLVKTVN
ncbi:MAG: T9SS type A sorting domain-containing protein [Bacteroidales bacterium]|nr:T9SS type A sorting domain-containing protein [Bacteroidales bacterium]